MGRRLAGLGLIVAGVAVGILWASGRTSHPFLPVVALLLFLAGASFFSKTSRFAERMRPLVGKSVRAQVWGAELPGHAGVVFRLHSVAAVGAGLHLYLRPLPDGSPIHLKVAQPRGALLDDCGVELAEAKYVQWAGRKLAQAEGAKALVLRTVDSE
jgi:xanthosine utilization system XapX-like protein